MTVWIHTQKSQMSDKDQNVSDDVGTSRRRPDGISSSGYQVASEFPLFATFSTDFLSFLKVINIFVETPEICHRKLFCSKHPREQVWLRRVCFRVQRCSQQESSRKMSRSVTYTVTPQRSVTDRWRDESDCFLVYQWNLALPKLEKRVGQMSEEGVGLLWSYSIKLMLEILQLPGGV